MSTEADNEKGHHKRKPLFKSTNASWIAVLLGCFFTAFVVQIIYAASFGDYESFKRIFAVSFMIGGGSALLGGVLGFLFGIPRVMTSVSVNSVSASPDAIPKNGAEYLPNTNLERISDWLTTLIIGATLINIKDIAVGLENISNKFGASLGNKTTAVNTDAGPGDEYALGLIIFQFLAGFFFAYLWARIFLQKLLKDAETKGILVEILENDVSLSTEVEKRRAFKHK